VYKPTDFRNHKGIAPAYWNCLSEGDESCDASDIRLGSHHGVELGPCFAPHGAVNWTKQVLKYANGTKPPAYHNVMGGPSKSRDDWSNFCRPGFIIIGAGKCGTSSLYHYLTDHPRVLLALEKQILYFKYYSDRSLKWYFHHFPTATSFLASGALMTGEASPGYLPYPEVAYLIRDRITSSTVVQATNYSSGNNNSSEEDDRSSSATTMTYVGPKIITVGREPIDRAYSSYKYNYVTPTLKSIRRGKFKHIPSDRHNEKPDSFYEQYLFSFEDMMKAELRVLKKCLAAPNGAAIVGARQRFAGKPWAQGEYNRRQRLGLPPMADLDEFCYGKALSFKVPRVQWVDLTNQYPEKVIELKNVHLKQSLIGRGLYTFPLEWWYTVFPHNELYFVCTEELQDRSGQSLNNLGDFLGLPQNQYNFSESVATGAFNVGGHRGYDKEIPWSEIEKDQQTKKNKTEIPLSAEFRKELEAFVRPYNERLFALVGRRCDW
jgi:hypothetical protein